MPWAQSIWGVSETVSKASSIVSSKPAPLRMMRSARSNVFMSLTDRV